VLRVVSIIWGKIDPKDIDTKKEALRNMKSRLNQVFGDKVILSDNHCFTTVLIE
jgi:hypothetical protein